MADCMLQNVAYRATVFRTGDFIALNFCLYIIADGKIYRQNLQLNNPAAYIKKKRRAEMSITTNIWL